MGICVSALHQKRLGYPNNIIAENIAESTI